MSDDVGLPIRQIRQADSSQGTFLTLGPPSAKKLLGFPNSPLSSNDTKLASRWAQMLTALTVTKLSTSVPSKLGNDTTLDAAAVYMCDSHRAYLTSDESDARLARCSGNRAMQSLRNALIMQGASCSDYILISVSLLLTAQYLIGVEKTDHQIHAIALSRMLKQRWKNGRWGMLEELLARNIVIEETGASILAGTVSEMDDPMRLRVRSLVMKDPVSTSATAWIAIADSLYQIPRLVLMVRQLLAEQDDPQRTVDTLTMAQDLFDAPSKSMIITLIKESSVKTTSTTNPMGSSIEYLDDDLYGVSVFYNMWRNVICGIIQRILDRVNPAVSTHFFDRDKVEIEDVEAAADIAMSVDFAFRRTTGPPFRAIRISTPMMISYGAWDRLRKRNEKADPTIFQHATNMKKIACENFNRATSMWHIQYFPEDKVARVCEAYSGGDIMPLLSRKR